MLKRFAVLAALGILCGLIMAHGQERKTAWVVEKTKTGGYATPVVKNFTVDNVWTAIRKTVLLMGMSAPKGDIQSGTMTVRTPGASIEFVLSKSGEGVEILSRWDLVLGEKAQFRKPASQAQRFFDDFFPELEKVLK